MSLLGIYTGPSCVSVQATNTLGLTSEPVSSDCVSIDATPPEVLWVGMGMGLTHTNVRFLYVRARSNCTRAHAYDLWIVDLTRN